MIAFLSPFTYAAAHRDAVILLDVRGDAYVIVEADLASPSPLETRRLDLGRDEVAADLRDAGLIGSRRVPDGLDALTPPPLGRGAPIAPSRIALLDVVAFVWVLLWTVSTYRWRSLEDLLRSARAGRPARSRRPAAALRLSRVFAVLMIWSPWQGRCLFRSLLLLRFLRARGADAQWVLAARAWPFLAHCWLQSGDVVLNDDPDRLLSFTALLAV